MRARGISLGMAVGAALGGALVAAPALAHPHMWLDTGIEVIFDAEGRASALRIRWGYDEFSSLVFIEERGLDADHDGTATPAEAAAKFIGFQPNSVADAQDGQRRGQEGRRRKEAY